MSFELGSQLLYQNATGLEKAMADADAERIQGTPAELVMEVWDPFLIAAKNLPFLAWAYSVDIWEDGWSEETQRNWTSVQLLFKSLRGTEAGIRMALDYAGRDFTPGANGYTLQQIVVPPGGFFAAPNLPAADFNEWIRLMPQIRIYVGIDKGTGGDEFFIDNKSGFVNLGAVGFDDGWERYGRKAILRQAGREDIQLRVSERIKVTEPYEAADFETITVPGTSNYGFFVNDFVNDDRFIGWEDKHTVMYTLRYDRVFDATHTDLFLTMLKPSQDPIDVTYERNSDIGDWEGGLYIGDGFVSTDFIVRENADIMLADYIYLLDKDVAAPMTRGVSFIGVDRIDIHKYQMELMIDLRTSEPLPLWFVNDSAIDAAHTANEDYAHIDRAIRAVRAAKAQRDRALVAFDPLRPLRASDYATESTLMEVWKINTL